MKDFVYGQNNKMLKFVPMPSVMAKDHLSRLMNAWGPTLDLTTTRKGLSMAIKDEEGEAPLAPKKKTRASSAIYLRQKGKVVALKEPKDKVSHKGWLILVTSTASKKTK